VLLRTSGWLVRGKFSGITSSSETEAMLTWLPSIVSLVLGAQPGKVYNSLRIISSRLKERF